ncbi:hypothetical protein Tco_0269822 [Tanacetum coccineum]
MLKVSPWKGVVRFGKRGKLNPKYVGSFKVLEKVGAIYYKIELPQELSRVHNTFHVSNLKKCYADEPLAVPLDGLHIDDKLHFVEEPVEIMDREVKRLKQIDSTVTYTEVSSPFKDLSDIGSRGVDGLPMMLEDLYVEAALQAPPSPDYVQGPEHPPSHVYVPYVPEPLYPEFIPPEDDMLLAEEQPLPAAILPTADSPGYITKSDPEEDPEEDDEDPEEDPDDYPTDRDDGKEEEEEEESSKDDVDDEEEDEDEEKDKEEEHLALTDSVPPPIHRVTARISIRAHTPILLPSETEVARLLNIPTTPPSPLSPWSSPLPKYLLHHYQAAMIWLRAESPSTSHPLPLPSPIVLPYTRASMAMMRAAAPSTYILAPRLGILPSDTPPSGTPPLLPIPLPTPLPLLLLPSTDCLRFEIGASSSAPTARPIGGFRAEYEFVGTLDDEIRRDHEIERMTDFVMTIRQDIDEIYRRLDDAQDDRLLMSGQLNMLRRDRRAHARTARLMETEARLSHKA